MNIKESIFVYEYLQDQNGGRAARAAGYAAISSFGQASRMLKRPHVIKALGDAVQARSDKLTLDTQWVIDELEGLYRAHIGDFIKIDDKTGAPNFDFSDVTDEQLSKLDSLEISPGKFGTKIKITLSNKLQTLTTIGKHVDVNAFKEVVEHKGELTLNFDKEDENA